MRDGAGQVGQSRSSSGCAVTGRAAGHCALTAAVGGCCASATDVTLSNCLAAALTSRTRLVITALDREAIGVATSDRLRGRGRGVRHAGCGGATIDAAQAGRGTAYCGPKGSATAHNGGPRPCSLGPF